MNIVSVTCDYADCTGGSAETVRQFAEALGCSTISFTAKPLLEQCVRDAGVVHVPLSAAATYGWPDGQGLRAAEEALRGAQFIFCHKLFRYHDDWVRRAATRWRIPYCVVPHGALDPYVFSYRALRKRAWMASLGRSLFRRSAGLLFATAPEREKAARFVDGVPSWVVGWPAPEAPAGDPESDRRRVRAQFGIPERDRVLLFLGRLDPMKRPHETIAAFLRAAAVDAHLIIAGPDGEYSAAELRALIGSSGSANVHVAGPAYGADKWSLYHAADAFVNLSARENYGYTVAEALAANLPVILSPGNALAVELDRVGCGWMLATDTAEECSAAIDAALRTSPEALRAMGARGHSWAARNASMGRFRSRLLTIVDEAVAA